MHASSARQDAFIVITYNNCIRLNSCFNTENSFADVEKFIVLILWCLTPFPTLFQLYRDGKCTYPCFPGALSPVLPTIFFPSHWLLSHITIVETTDSGERGMNPVAMTIIIPRKEYWPSRGLNQRPPVLKSATLSTELWNSARCKESCFKY